jgi:hypothetical protein
MSFDIGPRRDYGPTDGKLTFLVVAPLSVLELLYYKVGWILRGCGVWTHKIGDKPINQKPITQQTLSQGPILRDSDEFFSDITIHTQP